MESIKPHLTHPKYRPDIDGLRALGVVPLLVFHAFPEFMPGGFISVDIFFVISGFLISTILFSSLDKGKFSFSEFYARRIRRIFPAPILILSACFISGWFLLLPDEYMQLGKHIAGGSGYISNLLLWCEAGYFDNAAETKPLLHLWSLGIEEQFYIFWPLLLWIAWKRKFSLLLLTIIIALSSFSLNIKEVHADIIGAFYSPLSRFWELLSGSLLAWFALYRKDFFIRVKNDLSMTIHHFAGGLLQGAHALKSQGWKSVGVQLVLAALYIVAAIFTWAFPIPALEAITLWLAIIFFVTGALRLISAFQRRHFREWFWLVLSSAISILMGVLIMNGCPESSLWLPGMLIAIELLLQGWSLLFMGLAARSLIK